MTDVLKRKRGGQIGHPFYGGGRTPRPLIERFFEKVEITESCWRWTGGVNGDGYGSIGERGPRWRTLKAYRVAYEILVGPIPIGMEIDHLCHTADKSCAGGRACEHRRCVNPVHLEIVNKRENIIRGRGLPAQNRMKTHCPKGHAFDELNTYRFPDGRRGCRICGREQSLIYARKHRG